MKYVTLALLAGLCVDAAMMEPTPEWASAKVRSVRVVPDTMRLEVGDTGQATCEPRSTQDASGAVLGNKCAWASSNTGVVGVLASGQAARFPARKVGTAWITATASGKRDTVRLIVVTSVASSPRGAELFAPVVTVLPSTISLTPTSTAAERTLQGHCRDPVTGPIAGVTWTWTVVDPTTVASVASTKSAVTLTPVSDGETAVIGICEPSGERDTAIALVTGFPPDPPGCVPSPTVICVGDNLIAKVNAQPSGTAFTLGAGVHYITQQIPIKSGQSFTGPVITSGLGYPTEATGGAVIDGGRVLTGWTASGGDWYVGGQTQDSATATTTGSCQPAFPRCHHAPMVWRDGWAQVHVASLAACDQADEWYFDYAADRIYVCGDPTGDVIETNFTRRAFQGAVQNITIKRVEVRHFAANGQGLSTIQPEGTGWVIDSVYSHRNYGTGVRVQASNTLVRGGRFSNNGQYGVNGGNNGIGFTITGVRCDSNATAGWTRGFGSGCSKFFNTDGVTLEYSKADHNLGNGWWFDINNENTIIRTDSAINNYGTGFFYEISYGPVLAESLYSAGNGTVPTDNFQNGSAFLCSASAGCEVRFSEFLNNEHGPMTLQQDRGSGPLGAHIVENAYFHDNVIVQTKGSGGYKGAFQPTDHHLTRNNRWECNDWTVSGSFTFHFENGNKSDAQWLAAGHDDGACGAINRSP